MLTVRKRLDQLFKLKNPKLDSSKEFTKEELIERGFAPQNGKIDILFIFPPSAVAERYGREDMGDVGGVT